MFVFRSPVHPFETMYVGQVRGRVETHESNDETKHKDDLTSNGKAVGLNVRI